ncbi:MAG: deoxyguanosinetriphosphate triphosphohydrolase [Candidatus Gracilibacteria bacterium]|jgi:dGTPase
MILTPYHLAKNEATALKPYAVLSMYCRGRKIPEPEDKNRLPFQVDRDRIIHSKAFRRLKDKTQVFVAHHGDHYRTRLTHTLEVAQVSRDLARMLGLNEDLAETIALAHDLGHTPFGHAGEEALNNCLLQFGMTFEHNEQSKRIVTELEHAYPAWNGLNLNAEVLEGLMKHETHWDKPQNESAVRPSLEAQIVNIADEIAYQNHDTDDGLRSGLFTEEDLQSLHLWQAATRAVQSLYGTIEDPRIRIARTVSKMIGFMIVDTAEETSRRLALYRIATTEDVYICPDKLVAFSEEISEANHQLKDFLMSRLYLSPEVQENLNRGRTTIKTIFEKLIAEGKTPPEARDYLAGMTDPFALDRMESH